MCAFKVSWVFKRRCFFMQIPSANIRAPFFSTQTCKNPPLTSSRDEKPWIFQQSRRAEAAQLKALAHCLKGSTLLVVAGSLLIPALTHPLVAASPARAPNNSWMHRRRAHLSRREASLSLSLKLQNLQVGPPLNNLRSAAPPDDARIIRRRALGARGSRRRAAHFNFTRH
jgi:hypothetical protein